MSSTQEIIKSVYYDRSGYGSKQTTLKDAKQKDSSITINDINEFFSKNVEEKRKMRGENSFIAPHSFWEFQVDMFFISKNDLENQTFRIGMICIDIFSKYMHIVPIKSKTPPDILAGMMENINKMGGKPKLIYTDEEGSFFNQSVLDYLKEEKIELHRTRGHPAFAERGIQTFKDQLFKRVEADKKNGKQNIQWTDYIFEILLTYNNKNIHSATKFTPKDARMKKNEFEVKMNITMQARNTRKYPELSVGSNVKIMRKKGISEKAHTSHWLKEVFKVKSIDSKLGQSYFHLEGKTSPYLRHELLKV